MSQTEPITGGCLCGVVRYEASEPLYDAHYCHCRTCQKVSGAPVVAAAFLSRDAFRFTHGKPKFYRSSPVVERGFCGKCATYLLYRPLIPEWSDWVIVTIASLDHPESLPPGRHYGYESHLDWLNIQDDLPRERYEDDFIEILTDPNRKERAAVLARFGSPT
ncbi:MAG: GFA family protein [Kiloniellales bacterium]|nr:GFA family protein [Kiloniellales bacterium]